MCWAESMMGCESRARVTGTGEIHTLWRSGDPRLIVAMTRR